MPFFSVSLIVVCIVVPILSPGYFYYSFSEHTVRIRNGFDRTCMCTCILPST